MEIEDFSVVDLFCGIGGLTQGFILEGFNVTAGIDSDLDCKYAYETNNGAEFIHEDIGSMQTNKLDGLFEEGNLKILIGCAPCQPFSIFNTKNGGNLNATNSDRFKLLYSFSELIQSVRPSIISMENVPHLKTFQEGKIFKDFIDSLKRIGYNVTYDVLNAQDYGVPQRRKRLVLLASLLGPIEMVSPFTKDNFITVRDAIGDLPIIEAGEISDDDTLHRSRNLSELSLKRIRATPEGGGWKDWNIDLIADCHKKDSGKAYGSAYGRMSWDSVAPTMTTYCTGYNNGKFGHPEQDRAISLREAAILQSFPDNYDFVDPNRNFSAGKIARQIGNAVPVGLGVAIARSIRNHIEEI